MTIDRAVCIGIVILAMIYLASCASPPTARELCAAPPTSRLWDKACHGMHQPRRPPENLCSDPDGRALWPFDYTIRCKEK